MLTRAKVPAAENTLRILKLLSSRKGPITAAAIASALDLPRSSVYHLLAVMEQNGFVLHLPEEKKYGLGIGVFELSSAYSRQEPLSRLGRPLLAALVDRIGESAHLAVLHGRDVLYVVEERAKNRPSLVTDVGVRLPGHLTASGRAILAALPVRAESALPMSSTGRKMLPVRCGPRRRSCCARPWPRTMNPGPGAGQARPRLSKPDWTDSEPHGHLRPDRRAECRDPLPRACRQPGSAAVAVPAL